MPVILLTEQEMKHSNKLKMRILSQFYCNRHRTTPLQDFSVTEDLTDVHGSIKLYSL